MFSAIRCDACGAKVRQDRVRCLRCGAPLGKAPAPAPARAVSLPVIALVAGVIALGGFAALIAGRSGERPVPAVVETVTPAAAGSPAGGSAEDSQRLAARMVPAPIARSMDISRGGMAAYDRGDIAGSVEQFTEAVSADPQNADALNNLAQVLVRSGRAREAIPYFDRAIEISDTVWAYHFNRARAYAELTEWPRAVADYREAARLFPDDYVTAFNLARALQANGDLPGAIAEFERAITLAPGEPDFHLSLAFALETAQRPAEAAAVYRRYLELQEGAPQADRVQARIAELEGQGPQVAALQAP